MLDECWDIPWQSASAAEHTYSDAVSASAGNYSDPSHHQALSALSTKHSVQRLNVQTVIYCHLQGNSDISSFQREVVYQCISTGQCSTICSRPQPGQIDYGVDCAMCSQRDPSMSQPHYDLHVQHCRHEYLQQLLYKLSTKC